MERARAFAVLQLRACVQVAVRRRRAMLERTARTEQAIAHHLHALRCPEETQAGLFAGRQARPFDQAHRTPAGPARDVDGRISRLLGTADLHVGDPVLELVVRPTR